MADQPDDPRAACREAALRFLDQRVHSRLELQRKLARRPFPPAVITTVLDDLARVGLLDDAEYARAYCDSRQGSRAVGQARLRLDLRRRGVAAETIAATLSDRGDEAGAAAEADQALALGRRKWTAARRGAADLRQARAKVYRFLAGRGFSGGTCRTVIDRLAADERADDE